MPLPPNHDAATSNADSAADTSRPCDTFAQTLAQHFPSREALIHEARAMTEQQAQRKRRTLRSAGVVLPTLLIFVTLWLDPVWQTRTLRTGIGQISEVTLSDGSQVALNTNTILIEQRRLFSRTLLLAQGEAAFTVAAHWRPFVVDSGPIRVRDLSTVFAVRRLRDGSRITVLEGAVEVSDTRTTEPAMLPSMPLHAGQQIQTYDAVIGLRTTNGAPLPIETVNPALASAWTTGKIIFDGTPLYDAIREIQRYRDGPPILVHPRASGLRLSGVYDVRNIEQLLASLPRALPIAIVPQPNGNLFIQPQR